MDKFTKSVVIDGTMVHHLVEYYELLKQKEEEERKFLKEHLEKKEIVLKWNCGEGKERELTDLLNSMLQLIDKRVEQNTTIINKLSEILKKLDN